MIPSPLQKPDVTLSLTLSPSSVSGPASTTRETPEGRGIRLIELLLKCANHASTPGANDLDRADACLSQISALASVSGDSMQRLAAHFASALATRLLIRRWPGIYRAVNHTRRCRFPVVDDIDSAARALFSQAFPYLSFAYAIIARTLLQVMTHERVVHLVDLGSGDPKLWVPLLRSFARLSNGPPHLKVTCVSSNRTVLEKLGHRLVKEAEVLDLPFQFIPLNVAAQDLTPGLLQIRTGEALAFISILNLHALLADDDDDHHRFNASYDNDNEIRNGKRLNTFLLMIRSMSPKALFVVEQEADHNSSRLVDRFVDGLHYYSAVFDSIDATFGSTGITSEQAEGRIMVEEMFGREIENMVAYEGLDRVERHERFSRWALRMTRAGFRSVRMWYNSDEDAKQMVGAFGKEGYKIVSDRTSMMICWHDRPLYAVTTWTS
ncbi:unnamed protein product [Linum tenue]|uniref:Scarecrow-like protein 3 n=1 Tax=Linum tenue TaxID=586396 RepID=A0AAV0N7C3_9ROSI|nr:unnamed protein product [Linum tenue]